MGNNHKVLGKMIEFFQSPLRKITYFHYSGLKQSKVEKLKMLYFPIKCYLFHPVIGDKF